MNAGNLDTTNLLLGIMAAVSVLEVLLLIGVGIMAYRLYSQTMQTVREIEARQIAPLVARVNTLMTRVDAILADVKDVTARVSDRTERVDTAIRTTMNRVDETAGRVRSTVSSRVNRVLTLVHTARAAVDGFFHHIRRAEHA
jgi:methyl-accepting chemotaxis protein